MPQSRIGHILLLARATTIASVVCAMSAFVATAHASPEPVSVARVAAPHDADIERLLQRAQACLAAERQAEAEEILREILSQSPDHPRAYEAIVKVSAARDLAAVSSASRAAQQRLSDKFAIHQTDRFVLFSDVADDLTMQNAHWVERAHEEFMRFAHDCELRPLPLQHKLVCVLFDRREDYLAFAQSHDGLSNVAFTGYYSPRWDRVVFSVDQESPRSRAPIQADNGSATPSATGKSVLGFEGSTATHADACTADHPRHESLAGNAAAKCIHETIHQLMFHTRLMRCDVQYPLWICEGLSTAFETDSPNDAFGPDQDYAPRLEGFRTLLERGDLVPLRELVAVTQITSSKSPMLRAMYQQSYSLVTWMSRERKPQLRQYLGIMRQQSPGRLSPARHLEIFEQAFGEVESVEADWLAHERSR